MIIENTTSSRTATPVVQTRLRIVRQHSSVRQRDLLSSSAQQSPIMHVVLAHIFFQLLLVDPVCGKSFLPGGTAPPSTEIRAEEQELAARAPTTSQYENLPPSSPVTPRGDAAAVEFSAKPLDTTVYDQKSEPLCWAYMLADLFRANLGCDHVAHADFVEFLRAVKMDKDGTLKGGENVGSMEFLSALRGFAKRTAADGKEQPTAVGAGTQDVKEGQNANGEEEGSDEDISQFRAAAECLRDRLDTIYLTRDVDSARRRMAKCPAPTGGKLCRIREERTNVSTGKTETFFSERFVFDDDGTPDDGDACVRAHKDAIAPCFPAEDREIHEHFGISVDWRDWELLLTDKHAKRKIDSNGHLEEPPVKELFHSKERGHAMVVEGVLPENFGPHRQVRFRDEFLSGRDDGVVRSTEEVEGGTTIRVKTTISGYAPSPKSILDETRVPVLRVKNSWDDKTDLALNQHLGRVYMPLDDDFLKYGLFRGFVVVKRRQVTAHVFVPPSVPVKESRTVKESSRSNSPRALLGSPRIPSPAFALALSDGRLDLLSKTEGAKKSWLRIVVQEENALGRNGGEFLLRDLKRIMWGEGSVLEKALEKGDSDSWELAEQIVHVLPTDNELDEIFCSHDSVSSPDSMLWPATRTLLRGLEAPVVLPEIRKRVVLALTRKSKATGDPFKYVGTSGWSPALILAANGVPPEDIFGEDFSAVCPKKYVAEGNGDEWDLHAGANLNIRPDGVADYYYDLNKQGLSAFTRSPDLERQAVQMMLHHGVLDWSFYPALMAVRFGSFKLVRYLLEKSFEVDDSRHSSAFHRVRPFERFFPPHAYAFGGPLYQAARHNRVSVADFLVRVGNFQLDIQNERESGLPEPLVVAAYHGHNGVVDALLDQVERKLQKGEDHLLSRSGLDRSFSSSVDLPEPGTAIFLAAKRGYAHIVCRLLRAGANPTKGGASFTLGEHWQNPSPEEIAHKNRHTEVAEMLRVASEERLWNTALDGSWVKNGQGRDVWLYRGKWTWPQVLEERTRMLIERTGCRQYLSVAGSNDVH